MKTNKKYTNATFTKRVDHDGGRHHTARNSQEPLICNECGSVFSKRHWIPGNEAVELIGARELGKAQVTTCPGCSRKNEGVPEGFVYLEGTFPETHRVEIERLVNNEAKRVASRNPLAQIMEWSTEDDVPRISTTTPFLARRLGRELEKAFGGKVRYSFSHENKLVRAYWHKD